MSKVQRFEDLSIFQMARDLTKEVYAITKDGEFLSRARRKWTNVKEETRSVTWRTPSMRGGRAIMSPLQGR